MQINGIHLIDFYKAGHVYQYPEGTTRIFSNWTARKSRIDGVTATVSLGVQPFVNSLLDAFDAFFTSPLNYQLNLYKQIMSSCLGSEKNLIHIEELHKVGYLPLTILGLREGTICPIGVPSVVLWNTDSRFYWLTNYIESFMSNKLWKPTTSATIAKRYRKVCEDYANLTGTSLDFVDWQCHDFSYRGMSGTEDAILSGVGHLTQFKGTDTLPAILFAYKEYMADLGVGGSVPATEHSVMSAAGPANEIETFRRIIEDIYPSGVVSIVSDTWNLWTVLTDYIPKLKEKILARDGKLVIRPDSGNPVDIVCGIPVLPNNPKPEEDGVIRLLDKALGHTVNEKGYKVLNKCGCIYGDGITVDVATEILRRLASMGYASENIVFGVGSYTYEYQTRDTFGFAMKATASWQNGNMVELFKDPVTDSGLKKSHKGIVGAFWEDGKLVARDQLPNLEALDTSAYVPYLTNGRLRNVQYFSDVRRNARK